jgi:RNA polymerase subunit RPABC4/transcription elongation factor Spt4
MGVFGAVSRCEARRLLGFGSPSDGRSVRLVRLRFYGGRSSRPPRGVGKGLGGRVGKSAVVDDAEYVRICDHCHTVDRFPAGSGAGTPEYCPRCQRAQMSGAWSDVVGIIALYESRWDD